MSDKLDMLDGSKEALSSWGGGVASKRIVALKQGAPGKTMKIPGNTLLKKGFPDLSPNF